MLIRRPAVSVLAALALFGGTAALTGCSDTEGLDQRTGTSKDGSSNLSGNDPASVSQGGVYNHGNVSPEIEEEEEEIPEGTG